MAKRHADSNKPDIYTMAQGATWKAEQERAMQGDGQFFVKFYAPWW